MDGKYRYPDESYSVLTQLTNRMCIVVETENVKTVGKTRGLF